MNELEKINTKELSLVIKKTILEDKKKLFL